MVITRDGLREVGIATAFVVVGGAWAAWAAATVSPWYWAPAALLALLWLFVLAFFRDPERTSPAEAGLLVAPADGKVTEVIRLAHHDLVGGPAVRIGIFLSIFDVHINRAPCAGRVVKTDYRRGAFLDARHPESGARNESNTVVIQPDGDVPGPVVVRQVAGVIARRIICRVSGGETVRRGDRLGMIKFGSRTELIVPADGGLEAAVRVNDHVKGGVTVLLRMTTRRSDTNGSTGP